MGFVEDNPGRRHLLERCGLRYLGPVRNLERLLCSDVVDEVYVCLPLRTFHSRIRSIVNLCEGIGVPVRMPADFFATQAASTEFIHTKTGLYVSFGTHPEAGLRNVLATARDAMAARFRRHRKWRAVAVWELQSHGVLRPPKPSMLKKLMHGLAVPINLAWNVVRLKRLVKDTGHSHYRELKSDRLSCASHPIEHGVSAMLSLTAEDGPRKHAQRSQGATGCDDSRQ